MTFTVSSKTKATTVPHGGFVTSVFLRVAQIHFQTTLSKQDQPHTISLHLDFLRRTQIGPAHFTVRDVKLGRQTSVVHIALAQTPTSREEIIATIVNSNIHTEKGVSFPTGYSLMPPPYPVDINLLRQDRDRAWAMERDIPFPEFRKATSKTVFYFPRSGQRQRGSSDEWIRLRSGERWTNVSLGYVSDMWPMPVEAFISREESPSQVQGQESNTQFWYPTVVLNLEVKKVLPENGVEWLFCRSVPKQIKNGRLDVEIVILDEAGDIVALSQHVALAVSAERNLAARSPNAKL